jgi:hypothetical protein
MLWESSCSEWLGIRRLGSGDFALPSNALQKEERKTDRYGKAISRT